MIITGRSRNDAGQLAAYLTAIGENERVWIPQGFMAGNEQELRALLHDMEAFALHPRSRCEQPLYHATINPEPGEEMDEARFQRAVEMLAEGLGMKDRLCGVVMHEKEGRAHAHVVFNRVDPETGKAWHDGHNFARHEEIAERIAAEFGHASTPRAHYGREWDDPRPPFRPSDAEHQRAKRKGVKLADVRAQAQEARKGSDNGAAFIAALEDRDLIFARGNRRDFVIVDREGLPHNAAKLCGVRVAEMRAFMQDVEPSTIMSFEDAKAVQALMRQAEQGRVEPGHAAQSPSRSEAHPAPQPDGHYRDEAETARQLEQHDRAAAVGQARGAFQEAQERTAQPDPRAEAARQHERRAEAFAAALSGDHEAFAKAQREQRVMVAHDGAGFFAVTSRAAVALTDEQGYRALSALNARRDEEASLRLARLRLLTPERELPAMPKRLTVDGLPRIEDAQRLAFGMEQHAARRDQVRGLFDANRDQGDNGRAFFDAMKRQGMTVRPDYAGRLHVSAQGHDMPLSECVTVEEQRHALGNLPDRVKRLRFRSHADQQDSFARIVTKVAARRAQYARDQALRGAGRAVKRPVRELAGNAEGAAKATAKTVQAAATVLGKGLGAVSSIFEDIGKFDEREADAKAAPPPRAEARGPAQQPPRQRPDLAAPITQQDREQAQHAPPQSADLAEIYRRNLEEVRRRMAERDLEREQEQGERERRR